MKNLLLLLFVLPLNSFAQFNDWIVPKGGDTIYCKITLLNEKSVFYKYLHKGKTEKPDYQFLSSLDSYQKDGEVVHPSEKVALVANDDLSNKLGSKISGAEIQNRLNEAGYHLQLGGGALIAGMTTLLASSTFGLTVSLTHSPLIGSLIILGGNITGIVLFYTGYVNIKRAGLFLQGRR